MRAARAIAALIGVCAIVSSLEAATLGDLERALIDAVNARARIVAARERRIADASVLADEIARLKARAGDVTRAAPELENRLQRFDRLNSGLDQADTHLRDQDRLIRRLRTDFDAEADTESRRVTEAPRADPRVVASRLSDIDQVRRRVEQLTNAASAFRPVLEIGLAAGDTVADIDRKLLILVAERERATFELDRLSRDISVLDARETLKSRLLDRLESALREAPADMRVLRRQADDLTQALQDIHTQRQDLLRDRNDLRQVMVHLDERQAEFQARRRALARRVP